MVNNNGFKNYANKITLINVKLGVLILIVLSVIKIMTIIIVIIHQV